MGTGKVLDRQIWKPEVAGPVPCDQLQERVFECGCPKRMPVKASSKKSRFICPLSYRAE